MIWRSRPSCRFVVLVAIFSCLRMGTAPRSQHPPTVTCSRYGIGPLVDFMRSSHTL